MTKDKTKLHDGCWVKYRNRGTIRQLRYDAQHELWSSDRLYIGDTGELVGITKCEWSSYAVHNVLQDNTWTVLQKPVIRGRELKVGDKLWNKYTECWREIVSIGEDAIEVDTGGCCMFVDLDDAYLLPGEPGIDADKPMGDGRVPRKSRAPKKDVAFANQCRSQLEAFSNARLLASLRDFGKADMHYRTAIDCPRCTQTELPTAADFQCTTCGYPGLKALPTYKPEDDQELSMKDYRPYSEKADGVESALNELHIMAGEVKQKWIQGVNAYSRTAQHIAMEDRKTVDQLSGAFLRLIDKLDAFTDDVRNQAEGIL